MLKPTFRHAQRYLEEDIPLLKSRLKEQEKKLNKEIGYITDEIINDMMVYSSTREAGSTFGDIALRIDNSNPDRVVRRAATIIAKTHCIFALINKENYRKILSKIEAKTIQATINYFLSYPYLYSLSRKVIRSIHLNMAEVDYQMN